MSYPDILRAALRGFQIQLTAIDERIRELRRHLRPKSLKETVRTFRGTSSRFEAPPRKWTDRELATLREIYGTRPVLEVAASLGRTWKSVTSKAKVLRLGKRRYWTKAELARL